MRRVRPIPGRRLALFTTWDYHAFVTDRQVDMLEIEADHRRHAVVEQSIAELKSPVLRTFPPASTWSNAAWLALTVMAHNLSRAIGRLTELDLDRGDPASQGLHRPWPPGRLASSGRHLTLRLPNNWPWATAIERAIGKIQALPPCCLTSHRTHSQDLGQAGQPAALARPDPSPPSAARSAAQTGVTKSDGGSDA